jgi:hypothetical protein
VEITSELLGSQIGSSLGLGVILRVLEDMRVAWQNVDRKMVVAETLFEVQGAARRVRWWMCSRREVST